MATVLSSQCTVRLACLFAWIYRQAQQLSDIIYTVTHTDYFRE
jgi:hypothetical protein